MVPRLLAGLALAGVLGTHAAPLQAQPYVQQRDLLVLGGRLFDGIADTLRPNPGILVRAGTILAVGSEAQALAAHDADRLMLEPAEVILPGLIDLHAHYAMDLFSAGRIDETDVNPVVFLANGVTTTFPAGEMDPARMRALRQDIDAGRRPGPRILNSGPYFGSARPGWDAAAMTPDSIRKEVAHWAATGVRGFKAKGIAAAQLAPLIEAAHRHGLTVTGHLDSGFRGSVNPVDAIRLGIDRIEHFIGGDAIAADRSAYRSLESLDAARPEVGSAIRAYVQHGVRFDATLSAYGYFGAREPAVYERWYDEMGLLTPYAREVVEARLPRAVNEQFERIHRVKRRTVLRFFEEGGAHLITLGTDHPSWGEFFSGFGAHRELHALVLAGIPPASALRIATINGARAIGMGDRLGLIEPGRLADLFIVADDPLEDIRRTRQVRHVIRAGVQHDPAQLLEGVRGRLGPISAAEAGAWTRPPR